MAKKPYIYPFFLVFLILFISSAINPPAWGQPVILANDQPATEGLDAARYIASPTRSKIDLAGKWNALFETESVFEKWFGEPVRVEVKIPSSVDFEGRMTFSRTFSVNEEIRNNSILKLVALGINYESEIYINDVFIGKHVGGYTSFEFEIPDDALQIKQENIIKVIVNNRLSASGTLPVRKQIWGWKNYGGILRDIFILVRPRICLDSVHISTEINEKLPEATVFISGTACNNSFNTKVHDSSLTVQKKPSYFLTAELHERFSDLLAAKLDPVPLTVEANKDSEFKVVLKVKNPKLWNPENPELYVLKTNIVSIEGKQTALIDQHNVNIGFASAQIKDNTLLLNGQKIVLKGVAWYEDSPRYGASLSYEQMEKDVILIKSLGANAVRFSFHPPHPYMLNLCSRYGILVFEELPVWNVPAGILNEEPYIDMAETQAREAVWRDAHYPCLFAWGLGDQFDSAEKISEKFINRVKKVVRNIDNRPVYYGSGMLSNDACSGAVDFVGIDLPPSDLKNFRQVLTDWKKKNRNKPFVILSYGKEVFHNNRNGYSDPMSQESQARFFLQYYAAIKDAHADGSFINALADWRGDRPLLNYGNGGYYIHPIGLLNQSREKRLAYDVVKSLYMEDRVNIIPAGSYRRDFPWVHILIGLFVMMFIGWQTTNRRFGENLKRSLLRSYNFFVDLRVLHAVSIKHTLVLSGAISLTLADLLSNILYYYRSDKFADYIFTYFLVIDVVKEQFIKISWHPFIGIAALTCLFFMLGTLLAFIIKIFAFFIRARVTWFHAYSVSVWSAAPIIFLSPIAMILFKILDSSYGILFLVIILLFLFWTYLRILKGISVVYDLSRFKTYTAGILMCFFTFGGLAFFFESEYALSAYVKFILHLAQNPW